MALITDPDDLNQGTEIVITTGPRTIQLLIAGNLSADGVTLQAVYSFLKEEWKSDATLIPHPFPMICIDADAGKFEIGFDGANANGWVWKDATTRKLIRDGGWKEIDSSNVLDEEWAGIKTLGTFEDEANDKAYYAFGNDPTDTAAAVDFTYAGPVNEAVQTYHNVTPADSVTGFAITTNNTIARNDSGNWDTDGYKVGGKITIANAEDTGNSSTFLIESVEDATDGDLVIADIGPDAGTGFDFVDGGGGNDSIDRNDGGSWVEDGFLVGGEITVANATTVANDGTYTILALSPTTVEVATASLTADTGDNTATFLPLTNNSADTAMTAAVDNRNSIDIFLRIRDGDTNGKTFAQADLSSAGATILANRVFAFPLSNATDLKISETDANIAANSPYTQIVLRYFDQAFSIDVDTPGTQRDFGIVADVGTHSGVDGVSNGTTSFTTAEGGIPATTYDGGTLTIHEGTDKGDHTITTASGTTVTLSSALTGSQTNLSFSLQRSTAVQADAEEIYEKVQYLLRQAADIDSTDQTVNGKTADELMEFVGERLDCGAGIPDNPNGGGTGVIIVGFDSNDTNRLRFYDNGGTFREYPFVAAGTINFNANLVNDSDPEYWMFYEYTIQTTVGDLAVSGASGSNASIDSAGANLPTTAQNDYVNLQGFTNEENNGVWQVTDATPSTSQFDATKVDLQTVVNEGAASRTLDQDPINSPDAIIVDNNSGVDIAGAVGAAQVAFDYDYDGNTQGYHSAGTDAYIIIRAIGLETAQFVETTGVITRAVGLSYTLVSSLERNYDNP